MLMINSFEESAHLLEIMIVAFICGCHGNAKIDKRHWPVKISAEDEWTATESFSPLE